MLVSDMTMNKVVLLTADVTIIIQLNLGFPSSTKTVS